MKPEFYPHEIRNAEKQLEYMEVEYNKYRKRKEQISSPQYMVELQQRILALDLQAKKMIKSKKNMKSAQKLRERKLDQVIEDGEPEMLSIINKFASENTILDQKIKELDSKISKNTEVLQKQNSDMSTKKQENKIATDSAISIGIEPGILERNPNALSAIQAKIIEMDTKKATIEKRLNLVKTRYNVGQGEYKQKRAIIKKSLDKLADQVLEKNK